MNTRDPKLTALLFNECINTQVLDGLVSLMTNDHSLICFDHVETTDKESSRIAWLTFFKSNPGYLNDFSTYWNPGGAHSTAWARSLEVIFDFLNQHNQN